MANNRGHKSAEGASTSSECSNDLDLFELMKDIDDLTPEQLARIRKMNAHLEKGYKPTSSLFPGELTDGPC